MLSDKLKPTSAVTSKEHWQQEVRDSARILKPDKTYSAYFQRYLPRCKGLTALEIGACPGGHLLELVLSHGYQPIALDYIPEVHHLVEGFSNCGVADLEVIEADFLEFDTDRRFNVVMSFGFLEHFSFPEEILRRHWALVATGGFLIVGVPIFAYLQMLLRRLVLTSEQLAWTLNAHNRAIMNLDVLRKFCQVLPGCEEIVMASYVRNMETWFSPSDSYVRRKRAWIIYVWRLLALIPKWFNISCRFFSPYAIVIVRREKNPGE